MNNTKPAVLPRILHSQEFRDGVFVGLGIACLSWLIHSLVAALS